MGEPTQIMFKFSEVAEALVKRQGINEGHWGLLVKFAIAATNAPGPSGDLAPTAVVPIQEIGIQRFDKPNSLTVDASKVNPGRSRLGHANLKPLPKRKH